MAIGKLIITKGLPASGKSTWAERVRSENPVRVRVVTMDDIRVAVGARFMAGDEGVVQGIRDFTIREYLKKGYTVISADTNLNPRTIAHVQAQMARAANQADQFMGPVEIKDFTDVPLETCLERNAARWAQGDCKVPDEAIVSMYERFIKNQ